MGQSPQRKDSGRGANQGEWFPLHVRQEKILLSLVKAVNFIQEKHRRLIRLRQSFLPLLGKLNHVTHIALLAATAESS